jgi:dTDP-4-amino-4,6-dideoxygalactose transaminase
MDPIQRSLGGMGLVVIEDACHTRRPIQRRALAWLTPSCSAYPAKNLALWDGGMVVTNDYRIS